MSSSDDRIVRMQFDNAQFKRGAQETQKSLADVNKAVDSAGKGRGMLDLAGQMNTVQVTASKMAVVTTAALATITAKAVDSGLNLAKALTLNPIKEGFLEYEALLTKQNVIMNATGESAKVVKGYLNELNKYSDQTIYSFSDMSNTITKFVNAGISLPQAVTSIKGIANSAAFAGATTEEANRAMVAFSQSMSTGFIMLNDWMQIENANMATMGFKNELIKAGVEAGTLTKKGNEYITTSGKAITATKGWREGLQEQWATTEVMNKALSKYTDTNTKLGKEATQAATEVRTFTAFMDTLKESLASGWAAIFSKLIGGLQGATGFWTSMSNAINGTIGKMFTWAFVTLRTWRHMGGFTKTLEGFKNLLSPIGALFGAIGTAFKAAFPKPGRGAGEGLYGLSVAFEAITRPLTWLAKGITATTPVLKVFFQLIAIGVRALKEGGAFIGDFVEKAFGLISIKAPSGGGFLGFIKDLAKAIAKAVDQISDLLSAGSSLTGAFNAVSFDMPDLPSMPKMPSLPDMPSMPSLPSLPSLSGLMGGDDGGAESKVAALTSGVTGLKNSVMGLNKETDKTEGTGMFNPDAKLDTSRMKDISESYREIGAATSQAGDQATTFGEKAKAAFGYLANGIKDFFSGFKAEDLMASFNLAVLITFGLSIKRFIDGLTTAMKGFDLGALSEAISTFASAANKEAWAKLILNLAIAMGILAVSVAILAFIPADKLKKALLGLGVMLTMATLSLKGMSKAIDDMDSDGILKKTIGASIVIMALGVSMLFLSAALLIMNYVDWASIAKGLIVMGALVGVIKVIGSMTDDGAAESMKAGAKAIRSISFAMILLAGALMLFEFVDWSAMAKAGVSLGVVAGAVALMALLPAPALVAVGKAMLAVSASMVLLAGALVMFKFVEWESIGKLAVVLGSLAVALGAMMLIGGPVAMQGMIGLGIGMMAIATAGLILNKVDWSSVGKIAAILGILVVAVAALGAVAYFAAGPLLMLGGAFALIGLGVALFGGGIMLLVTALGAAVALGAVAVVAFSALATAAAVAIGVFLQTLALQAPIIKDSLLTLLQTLIDGIVEAVPMIIQGIKDLWSAIMAELGGGDKGGGKQAAMSQTGQSWISKLAEGIKKKLPAIVRTAVELIIGFINGLASKAKDLAIAAGNLIVQLIKGISNKIDDIIKAGVDLVVKMAKGVGDGLPKLVKAGIQLIVDFLHALADGIRNQSGDIGGGIKDVASAFFDVGVDIVEGLGRGIASMGGALWDYVMDLVGQLPGWAKKLLGIQSPSKVFMKIGEFVSLGLAKGIQNTAASAIVSVAKMVGGQIAVANEYINAFIQRLDQQSTAARAKAEGLAAAAKTASKYANKTKTKTDDRAANRLGERAEKQDKKATAAEKKAEAAKERQDRAKEFKEADSLGKAKMKSEDAQRQLDAVKASERKAAAALVEADALDKQAKAAGVTAEQRKKMRQEADRLRKQAREDAQRANAQLKNAREAAAAALVYQRKAGAEAAAAFEAQFQAEAKSDADALAYDKLSDADKAAYKREEAARLEAQSKKDLAKAKKLAFTDIEAANALAQLALSGAEAARQALQDAISLEASGSTGATGEVLALDPTAAALASFNQYSQQYAAAQAAAASAPSTVEFNQYNSSPESLSDTEIYRQTNNLLTYAAGSVGAGV